MESSSSGGGGHHLRLPPGFRFHPTDEELIVHYLQKKAASAALPVAIIAEVDLYKYDPWELPSKAIFGEQEWYFFSPRERKYPNGERPNRAATSGYWKATGTDKPILTANGARKVGVKKALVFYSGKPPKGVKTNWIMHEYRLLHSSHKPPGTTLNNNRALDDWVLCRIFKKSNWSSRPIDEKLERDEPREDVPTSSMDMGYHRSPIFNYPGPTKPWNFFSGPPLGGNGSAISTNVPMAISPFLASSSDPSKSSKHILSSQYLANDGALVFSSKQWEGHDLHDGNNNPSSSPSDHRNTSITLLLNDQQYYSHVNTPGDGPGVVLHQSYRPSQFPASINNET